MEMESPAVTKTLRRADTTAFLVVLVAFATVSTVLGVGFGILAGVVLILMRFPLLKEPQPQSYDMIRRMWNLASASFILIILALQVFFDRPSHIALIVVCYFLLLHKWSTRFRARDFLELWGLTVLLMMVACLKGTGSLVIGLMVLWLGLSGRIFAILSRHRAAEKTSPLAIGSLSIRNPAFAVSITTVIVLSLAIYLALPKTAFKNNPHFDADSFFGGNTVGFNDSIDLGQLSRLNETSRVAFRGSVIRGWLRPDTAYFRMATVNHYDGRRWRSFNQGRSRAVVATPGQDVVVQPGVTPERRFVFELHDLGYQGVQLPLPDGTVSFRIDESQRFEIGADGAVRQAHGYLPEKVTVIAGRNYTAERHYPQQASIRLSAGEGVALAQLRQRIFREAPGDMSPFEKIRWLNDWLITEGVYTLNPLPATRSRTAMERFVYEGLTGHCEIFASAATMILTQEGIPARIVLGYKGFVADGQHSFLVPEANAHAWVEAWVDEEEGWVRIDPTPPSNETRLGLYFSNSTIGRLYKPTWLERYDGASWAAVASVSDALFAVNFPKPSTRTILWTVLVVLILGLCYRLRRRLWRQRQPPPREADALLRYLAAVLALPPHEASPAKSLREWLFASHRLGEGELREMTLLLEQMRYRQIDARESEVLSAELRRRLAHLEPPPQG